VFVNHVMGDVVGDVVARQAFRLSVKDACEVLRSAGILPAVAKASRPRTKLITSRQVRLLVFPAMDGERHARPHLTIFRSKIAKIAQLAAAALDFCAVWRCYNFRPKGQQHA